MGRSVSVRSDRNNRDHPTSGEIFTHFIRQFIFVGRLGVWGFRYVWGAFFLERGIFTHLLRPFIYARLIISVHGCFTAVMIRQEPSRIVAARANLATRLESLRSVNFFRGRCTLPEVHFRYPFSMTSGVTVETFGDDL